MKWMLLGLALQEGEPATTKEAMRRVQLLVGGWKVAVVPKGTKAEAWVEKHAWSYKIEKDEFSLQLSVTDGKVFQSGELTYDLKERRYRFRAIRAAGGAAIFEGKLGDRELALEEVVEKGAAQERIEIILLRENRHFVSIEKREAGRESFLMTHSLGCTKEGVPFLRGEMPKCVVTGGMGVIEVRHGGKSYTVC